MSTLHRVSLSLRLSSTIRQRLRYVVNADIVLRNEYKLLADNADESQSVASYNSATTRECCD